MMLETLAQRMHPTPRVLVRQGDGGLYPHGATTLTLTTPSRRGDMKCPREMASNSNRPTREGRSRLNLGGASALEDLGNAVITLQSREQRSTRLQRTRIEDHDGPRGRRMGAIRHSARPRRGRTKRDGRATVTGARQRTTSRGQWVRESGHIRLRRRGRVFDCNEQLYLQLDSPHNTRGAMLQTVSLTGRLLAVCHHHHTVLTVTVMTAVCAACTTNGGCTRPEERCLTGRQHLQDHTLPMRFDAVVT